MPHRGSTSGGRRLQLVEDGAVERAVRLAERGDLAALQDARLEGDAPEADVRLAQSLLLAAARSLYGGLADRPPTAAALAGVGQAAERARALTGWACALAERRALVTFDAVTLTELVGVHRALPGQGDVARAWALAAEAWRIVWCEEAVDIEAPARAVQALAARAAIPELAIEVPLLRALADLDHGDLDAAAAHARRASRMARAEGLCATEWLANLVLARVRRHTGRLPQSARILSVLAAVTPRAWHGWVRWELVLTGGPAAPRRLGMAGGAGAPRLLADLIEAAAAADRPRFDAQQAALDAYVSALVPLAREARLAAAVLDPSIAAPAELAAWRDGGVDLLPAGLGGLATRGAADGSGPEVRSYVLAGPARPPVRVLEPGVALAGACVVDDGGPRGSARTAAALAVLAQSSRDGIALPEFFRRVYGFSYCAPLHKGVVDVLLHRMRRCLAEAGHVSRRDDRVKLTLTRDVIIPDLRGGAFGIVARVLAALATRPQATADELATELDVHRKTVLLALHELVSEGACVAVRAGRRVYYRVEDTTFTEPTGWQNRRRSSS